MHVFALFVVFWLAAWAIFLLTLIVDRDGATTHPHTLLDDIEVSS